MQSPDHPTIKFVQAKGFTVGRPGPPLWIVWHTMEASEYSERAESTAAYFANPGDGRRVSSHYCGDVDSVVQCVLIKDTAWTVGNTPGNGRGINVECAGFARQSRADWLDPFSRGMFNQLVPILKVDAADHNIPAERRTVAELRRYVPGHTSHNDLRLAFGGTTHTDPGDFFPWDVVLPMFSNNPAESESAMRYRFVGFPDTPPAIGNRVHSTHATRYRIVSESPAIHDAMEAAGAGPIITVTPASLGTPLYADAVAKLCGTLDPGELAGEGGGGSAGETLTKADVQDAAEDAVRDVLQAGIAGSEANG